MARPFLLGCVAVTLAAPTASAQSITDIGARTAPQFHSYKIDSPSNEKISEFAVPLFVLVPITSSLSVDVGTSYAQSHVEQTLAGKTTTSSISGLTDTQVRANYVLGNDFVVLTAGVNLPTGRSTVSTDQQLAAGLIGSDFLSFPISSMGTGFGATGGVALARPVGDWNLGLGLSMRRSAQYDPYDAVAGSAALHYQPGNEYRARAGVDRALGTGRVAVGITYSSFGKDKLDNSLYNTGNRLLAQASVDNAVPGGQLSLSGWNLFRRSGHLADGSELGPENITNADLAYGINAGSMVIEPNIEGRLWLQDKLPTSALTTIGIRTTMTMVGFSVLPSVGYSVGRLAATDQNSVTTTATLTGFHAALAIRIR